MKTKHGGETSGGTEPDVDHDEGVAKDQTTGEPAYTQPYRQFSVKRYVMATLLFAFGATLLIAPIPGIGSVGLLLISTPPILVLFLGWYVGRPGLAATAHLLHRRRHQMTVDGSPVGDSDATPSLSILIPAYNEATDIGETIASIKRVDYRGDMEIVVVDDGSEDGTWHVLEVLADAHDNLRVVTQENSGSAAARNTALDYATNEVVISLDADTVLHETALTEISRHFTSEDVVAVGGNVSVENMEGDGIWAKLQVFDYALAMEIGRMFQSTLGFVLCLSGAFGAFRRETLLEAGGWNEHWLYSDDFEVSLRIHEYGDVRYSPKAIADTVVPTSISGWFHQRKAWAQRGISVMLLHHKKQLNPKEGMIGLIGLPLRAILTVLIITEILAFGATLVFGSSSVAGSLAWVSAAGLISITALCSLMLGVLTLLVVDEKPIKYSQWVVGYLFFYRPLHTLARLYGFSQALWWEVSSFGGSLRTNPKGELPFLGDGTEDEG